MTENNNWHDAKTDPPTQSGEYLCCYKSYVPNVTYKMQVHSYALRLRDIDKYDFEGTKRGGWYDYDGEYGYYEITRITHWRYLPEPPLSEVNA